MPRWEIRPNRSGRRILAFEFDLTTWQQERVGAHGRLLGRSDGAAMDSAATKDVARHVFESEADELAACARWARAQLDSNPNALIAIVAPMWCVKGSLSRVGRSTDAGAAWPRNLKEVCDPALVNFSLGEPFGRSRAGARCVAVIFGHVPAARKRTCIALECAVCSLGARVYL